MGFAPKKTKRTIAMSYAYGGFIHVTDEFLIDRVLRHAIPAVAHDIRIIGIERHPRIPAVWQFTVGYRISKMDHEQIQSKTIPLSCGMRYSADKTEKRGKP